MRRLFITASVGLVILSGCTTVQTATPTPKIAAVERAFNAAKSSEPELINFLERMPKGADLHNHLEGTIFSEYVLRAAENQGLNYDLDTNQFTEADVSERIISTTALKYSMPAFRAFREAYSVRRWRDSGGSGRDAFFAPFDRYPFVRYAPEVMLRDLIKRSVYQNIQHQETASPVVPPQVTARFMAALEGVDVADLDAAFAAVEPLTRDPQIAAQITARIDGWEAYAGEQTKALKGASDLSIVYGAYVVRIGPLKSVFANAAANFTAIQADPRVVSFGFVAPEDHPDSNDNFDKHMQMIDYLWQRLGKPKVNLHAGELTPDDVAPESLRDRIRKSIDIGHSNRIGHGVSIAWEADSQGLLEQMARDGILVEICLSSNEIILDVVGNEHPFTLYRKAGVPVSLNTDDEGIGRNSLTYEFTRAILTYNLSYSDIIELARNSLEYSFLAGESLFVERDYQQVRPGFEGSQNVGWIPTAEQSALIASNPKLSVQLRFERSLAAFAASFETDLP